MIRLLAEKGEILDVLDAGTTMRFLTACMTALAQNKVLTGTARMKERPIGILVDALRELGAKIDYLEADGFPPIRISGENNHLSGGKVQIRGDVSSQYISALLMIAPTLEKGLELELLGKMGSRPYIEMTLQIMRDLA